MIRLRSYCMAVLLLFLTGCSYQVPVSQSEDAVELHIAPDQMILKGGTMGSTRRFQILFFGFGERNSFYQAELEAVDAVGAELLVNRLRLRHYEGMLIPGSWLQAFGFVGATDFPILGWEVFTVAGTGVRLVRDTEPADSMARR